MRSAKIGSDLTFRHPGIARRGTPAVARTPRRKGSRHPGPVTLGTSREHLSRSPARAATTPCAPPIEALQTARRRRGPRPHRHRDDVGARAGRAAPHPARHDHRTLRDRDAEPAGRRARRPRRRRPTARCRPGRRTQTRDRDPGHYTRSSRHCFFGDLYHSRLGDADASQRLAEHNRALTTGVAGAGVVPPHWLAEEFDALARQGRGLCNAVRNIPLGDDPRPITLPKQTAGTDGQIAQQATENTHPGEADAWTSATDMVTPKPFAGLQIVAAADARHEQPGDRRADLRRHGRRATT